VSALIAGAVGDTMDVIAEGDGTRIIITLGQEDALIFLAQVHHAVAAICEWRPPQSLADVLG